MSVSSPLSPARIPRRDHRYRTGTGTILHGLGDGPGSVQWQSDVMPSQFWHDAHWTSEQRLYAAVLEDALRCLREVPGVIHQWSVPKARQEAETWLLSDDPSAWALSFVGICEALRLDADWIRAGILNGRKAA